MKKIEVPGGLSVAEIWQLIAKSQYDAAYACNAHNRGKDAECTARAEYLQSLLPKETK